MMKQVPQRRPTVPSGGPQASRKQPREVTVVKHFQPNPILKGATKFPEVKAYQDFPSTTRYLQLNPVFKLVDNFLASQGTCCNGTMNPSMKNRCGCIRNVQGDASVTNYTTKTSPAPATIANCPHKNHVRLCTNAARIRSNIENINCKINDRVSLKNGCVPPRHVTIAQSAAQSDYVEQLKAEIKGSRVECGLRKREDSDYITKLKDEIIVNKTECINQARAIINELKNEILNFRLRPKSKYSSSCSDLHTYCDKAVKTSSKSLGQRSKESPEGICACAAKQATCCPSPGKEKAADLERLRPCETLWRSSRGSFASSSDMDAGSLPSPGVNFERKLEEANSLIEKVRKALRDIGKGIQHQPSERRQFFDINEPVEECSNDSKCINGNCSTHGTCCSAANKTATECEAVGDLQKQKEEQLQKQKEKEEELQKEKEALRKQMEEQLRKQIEEEMAKQKADELQKLLEEQLQKDELVRKQKEEELRKKEEELRQLQELSKKKEEELQKKEKELEGKSKERLHLSPEETNETNVGELDYDNVTPSSMELLQRKLKAICEMSSESDLDVLEKDGESDPTVLRVEMVLENNETMEEEQREDNFPRSTSTEFTESSNFAEENVEAVGEVLDEKADPHLKLLYNTEINKTETAEECCGEECCDDVPDVERRSRESRQRKQEEFEARKRSRQESKSSKSSDFESSTEELARRSSKQSSRRSKKESLDLGNRKGSTDDFEGRRRNSNRESKSSKSYDVAFEERNCSTEDEARREGKQSKSKSSTEASSSKSAKLSIQVMPSVNIRGGLVMQRTLHLCIKPTGSGGNIIVPERSNVGYREVKTECEKEEKKESPKHKCPQECSDLEYHCKYRALSALIGPRKSKSETLDTASAMKDGVNPDLVNALNEKALLLYKSYQVLDHKYLPSNDPSLSSVATLSHRMAKNIADTKRKSITSHLGKKPIKVPDKTDKDIIKQVLEHGRSPWEIGFYQTKSTQCSGTSLNVQRRGGGVLSDDDSEDQSSVVSHEVPVKDESPVADTEQSSIETASRIPNMSLLEVINALKSSANAEMQKLLMEHLKDYDTASESMQSKRSQVVVATPTGAESPPWKFEPLTERDLERRGPRKSILSNRISFSEIQASFKRHMKKSVSSTSSSGDEEDFLKASAALIAADSRVPKEVASSSTSVSTTSSSTSSSYNIRGSEKESLDPSDLVPADEPLSKKDTPKVVPVPVPVPEITQAEEKQPEISKTDENVQVSLTTDTSGTESSLSRDRMDTITCFIKGLTGTSQEKLEKLRSNPSFPKTDLQGWSTTQMKTLEGQSKENKEMMSRRSMYEVDLEEIMDSHDYGDKNEEDASVLRDKGSDSTVLSERAQKKRLKDFQTFAKETMVPSTPKKTSGSSKSNKKKTSTIVMTMTEERDKMECGDEGSTFDGSTRRNLPFYKRVLGQIVDPDTRQPAEMAQSDPIPMDDSVSEGEIKCRCSVSIGEVHPCKYSMDKYMSGVKHLKKHPEESARRDFGDKSLRISRQRTQYNNWVAFYLQKRKPIVFNDSSSTSPINSTDK